MAHWMLQRPDGGNAGPKLDTDTPEGSTLHSVLLSSQMDLETNLENETEAHLREYWEGKLRDVNVLLHLLFPPRNGL